MSCGTNAITCGALSCSSITDSRTLSCTNITSTGTFTNGTNSMTTGAITASGRLNTPSVYINNTSSASGVLVLTTNLWYS
jgi:hypothetical protein